MLLQKEPAYNIRHPLHTTHASCYFKATSKTSTQKGCSGSWSSQRWSNGSARSTWFQPVKKKKGPAEQLTCAGIVIDPDVARMADAHEGARGVNAHGVLPAVVLPFGALINIWKEGRENGGGGTKAGWDVDCCHISIIWICEVRVSFSDFNPSHSKVSIGSVVSWILIDLHVQVRKTFVRRLRTPSGADQTIFFISILHWKPHASYIKLKPADRFGCSFYFSNRFSRVTLTPNSFINKVLTLSEADFYWKDFGLTFGVTLNTNAGQLLNDWLTASIL